MKKTFTFENEEGKVDRKIESIRHEIKKYIARERRKELPEEFDLWNFDCKFGLTAESAEVIKESEIKGNINRILDEKHTSFYIEIVARPGNKPKKSS